MEKLFYKNSFIYLFLKKRNKLNIPIIKMTFPLYFTQVWDNTHFYNINKTGRERVRQKANVGSLLEYIENDPELTKIKYLIHLANFDHLYNDPNANFTLLLPKDSDLKYLGEDYFSEIDRGSAVKILNHCTIHGQFYIRDLNSPFLLIETKGKTRLRIERSEDVLYIDRTYKLDKNIDIQLGNGVIHYVDGLMCPRLL